MKGTRRDIICYMSLICIMALMFMSNALGEQVAWDCPECGRTSNTGNYCGGCGHSAPWMSKEPVAMHYYEEMYYEQTYVLDYYLLFEHDTSGRIITVRQYDSANNFVASVDQAYDAVGNCTIKYSLSTNTNGLYLNYRQQLWENGHIVRTENSDGMYSQEYNYNEKGKLLTLFFYENGNHYMTDTYSYDQQDRRQKVHRENFGNWIIDIEYLYEGNSIKPYYVKWGDDAYYQYTYEYDTEGRLVSEISTYYYNNKLSSITTKTYEY